MKAAQREELSPIKPFLTGIKIGLVCGGAFAITETLVSTLKNLSWYRFEGPVFGLKIELYSMAVYIPSILAVVLILSIPFYLTRKTRPQNRAIENQDVILSGALVWLLVFMLLESFAPPARLWGTLVQAAAFSAAGLFVGTGLGVILAYLKKRSIQKQPANIIFILVLSGFAFHHVLLTLFFNTRLQVYPHKLLVIILAFAGSVFLWFGWKWVLSKDTVRRYVWISLFIILLFSPLSMHQWKKPLEPDIKNSLNTTNVILIISDALRADSIGINVEGYATPHIDKMAREGVLFKRAYSQAPWTLPSMLSAISSRYPSVLQREEVYIIPDSFTTLTETLRSSGYFTKLLLGNGSLNKACGFIRGFDDFEIFSYQRRRPLKTRMPMLDKLYYLYLRAFDLSLFPDLTKTISKKARKFLDSYNQERPFFFLIYYMDPHIPYNPPERLVNRQFQTRFRRPFAPINPWHIQGDDTDPQLEDIHTGMDHLSHEDKAFIRYLYEAEVRYIDEKAGEIIELLRERDIDRETLVIFTSDHGEEFWDHRNWGHGQNLYQELVHIPLIIWGAKLPSREVDTPVALIDLAPTLLEFLDLPIPEEFQGESFLPLIHGEAYNFRPIFAEAPRHFEEMKSVQHESYKLIWWQEKNAFELYDLSQDELEKRNIYRPDHPAFESLEKMLFSWTAENYRLKGDISREDFVKGQEEDIKRHLKTLGYFR